MFPVVNGAIIDRNIVVSDDEDFLNLVFWKPVSEGGIFGAATTLFAYSMEIDLSAPEFVCETSPEFTFNVEPTQVTVFEGDSISLTSVINSAAYGSYTKNGDYFDEQPIYRLTENGITVSSGTSTTATTSGWYSGLSYLAPILPDGVNSQVFSLDAETSISRRKVSGGTTTTYEYDTQSENPLNNTAFGDPNRYAEFPVTVTVKKEPPTPLSVSTDCNILDSRQTVNYVVSYSSPITLQDSDGGHVIDSVEAAGDCRDGITDLYGIDTNGNQVSIPSGIIPWAPGVSVTAATTQKSSLQTKHLEMFALDSGLSSSYTVNQSGTATQISSPTITRTISNINEDEAAGFQINLTRQLPKVLVLEVNEAAGTQPDSNGEFTAGDVANIKWSSQHADFCKGNWSSDELPANQLSFIDVTVPSSGMLNVTCRQTNIVPTLNAVTATDL